MQASSINAFGCFWGNTDITPRYLPIDEAHPTYTTDPYSFSKTVIEEIGDYYWRREGISSVALRLPAVWSQARMESDEARRRRAQTRACWTRWRLCPRTRALSGWPKQAQKSRQLRRQKIMEYPAARPRLPAGDLWRGPLELRL